MLKRIVTIVLAACLLTGIAASVAPLTPPAEAGQCMGLRPLCLYPDRPVCICQGLGPQGCRWVCGH